MVRPSRIESSSPSFRAKPAAHADGAAPSERLTNVRKNSTNQHAANGHDGPWTSPPPHTEPSTSGSEKPLTASDRAHHRTRGPLRTHRAAFERPKLSAHITRSIHDGQ
jgi:hypothetical protein